MIHLGEKVEYKSISDKAENIIDRLYQIGYNYHTRYTLDRPDGSKVEVRRAYRNKSTTDKCFELQRVGSDVLSFKFNDEMIDIDKFLDEDSLTNIEYWKF